MLETVAEELDDFEKTSGKTLVRIAGVCGETPQARQEALLAKELGYDAGFGSGTYADDVASFAVSEMVKRGMK